ncbi:MAG: iron-containing alcohol dehydrogenase, partial [Candidatus Hydrogenedentota bacterium]
MTGIAFTNSRLGAVHGLAHPVGALYSQPHGLVCAVLLPYIMEFNAEVAGDKYGEIAALLGARKRSAAGAIAFIKNLLETMEIPDKLGLLGLRAIDVDGIIRASMPSGSLKANPRKVSENDLETILTKNLSTAESYH